MRHSLYAGLVLATLAVLTGPQPARAQFGAWDGSLLSPRSGPVYRGQAETDSGIPGRSAITAPIPTGNPGQNGFYAFSEFVMLTQTRALGDQTVAVRGLIDSTGLVTGLPGTLIGSGFPALTTDQLGRSTFMPGWNAGLGYKFDSGVSVYVSFMQLLDAHYSAGATLVSPFFRSGTDLADTFLTSAVFNFPRTMPARARRLPST